MRSLRKFFLSGVIAVGLVLLLAWRFEISGFLTSFKIWLGSFSDSTFSYENFKALKMENQSLKAELAVEAGRSPVVVDRYHYLLTNIYSRYPWNDRGLIVIEAGSADGLKEGLPVLAGRGIIFGKIKTVHRTQSEVQTIFDPAWRESVKIGEGTEALLQGGLEPRLDLIPKEAVIEAGDKVRNISPDFPFDFFVGSVKEIKGDNTETWQSASLDLPYSTDSLRNLLVITDFP